MDNIGFSKTGLIYYKEPISKESLKAEIEYLKLDEDVNIRYDLYYVLNLNCNSIKEQRERVLGAVRKILFNPKSKVTNKMVKKYLDSFETKGNEYSKFCEKYGEFSQVAIFELKKHIKE
jgi:hypothetical protein